MNGLRVTSCVSGEFVPSTWAAANHDVSISHVSTDCGCAKRMREKVLPEAGYTVFEGAWIGPDGDIILDSEVEEHHTRLMLKRQNLQAAAVRAAAKSFVNLFNGNP